MGAHEEVAHLRELTDQRFEATDKAMSAALAAAQAAVTKAEVANEKRFESVNEFRAQLADQTRDLLTRREYEANHAALMRRMEVVEKIAARDSGMAAGDADRRERSQWSLTTGLAALGVLISLVVAVVVILRTH